MMRLVRTIALSAAASLSGCVVGPDYVRTTPEIPAQYSEPGAGGESAANLPFWKFFNSPELHDLIRTALRENHDLGQALERIAESRARVGFVRADQFPTFNLSGDAARVDPGNTPGAGAAPYNDFRLGSDVSFEVDLWGRYRRATQAERAELLASVAAYRTVTLALVSEVAVTYFLLLDLDNRCAIADQTIKNRREATSLIRSRFEHGIVPEVDVHQATIEELDAVATRAELERSRRLAQDALNVLLGRLPQVVVRTGTLKRELIVSAVPLGFPADLLERRPDVIAAEQRAKAAFERIGVAQAQRLPSLSLLGFIGLRSADASEFLRRDALSWDTGGALLGPLIDFGRSRARVEIARAQAEQAVQQYQQTVLVAAREVEDSLAAIQTYQEEHKARLGQRDAAASAAVLSRARYNDGFTTYLEVLDIERSLFNAELTVSATYQAYLTSIVRLYAALGGGWLQEERS